MHTELTQAKGEVAETIMELTLKSMDLTEAHKQIHNKGTRRQQVKRMELNDLPTPPELKDQRDIEEHCLKAAEEVSAKEAKDVVAHAIS